MYFYYGALGCEFSKDILYNHLALLTAGKNMGYIFEDIPMVSQREYNEIVTDIDKAADDRHERWTRGIVDQDDQNRENWILVTLPVTNQLDYKFSEEFSRNLNCFVDADQLNISGANAFPGQLFLKFGESGVVA